MQGVNEMIDAGMQGSVEQAGDQPDGVVGDEAQPEAAMDGEQPAGAAEAAGIAS